MTLFLFQEFFKRRRQGGRTAANTLRFKKKHLVLNDRIADKVVLFKYHNGHSLDLAFNERELMALARRHMSSLVLKHPHCQNRWHRGIALLTAVFSSV
jgi:hypothetical protein